MTNVDWSPYLRLARRPFLRRLALLGLRGERRERLRSIGENVVVHDLRRGIPWPDASVDAVYHSHVLEHLDREAAGPFVGEVLRVLRPGGIQRIVVPDLERIARRYLDHLESCTAGSPPATELRRHDDHVAALVEQSVRREAHGTSRQPPVRRAVENLLLGDARRRGETHQWMYDRVNLEQLLSAHGFVEVRRRSFNTSDIPGWERIGLDRNTDGTEYLPDSLYVEARRPS